MFELRLSTLFKCVFLLFFINIQLSDGLRILGIFPFNMKSHFIMPEELCKALAAKGHQVDVYGHFPQKTKIKNYHDYQLPDTLPALSNNMTYEEVAVIPTTELMRNWIGAFQGPMCELLGHPLLQKLLNDPPKNPPYDLVITELTAYHCFIPLGRHFKVPLIGMVTPPLLDWQYGGFDNPINFATVSSPHSTYVPPMTFFERLDNFIYYHHVVRKVIQYGTIQEEYVEKYFGPGLPSFYDLQREVDLVLVNHDVSLNGMVPFSPRVIPVGGLHVVDYNETLTEKVQKWLDESKHGCVYFSFGSAARIETFPKYKIEAFYKTFKNIAPVRVLLKIAKVDELPPGLPSNVLVQNWFQQMAVLKHQNLKAFVTHGGLMGGQESIHFGVPMVVVPLFGDQFRNAKSYAQRNVAVMVNVNDIAESTFTNALNEVLKNPKYRESVEKLSKKIKDRPVSVMDTAIFWVEYMHRHGKNALRPSSDELLWWQKSLLDVYAFLGTGILIVSYIVFKLISILISLVKSYSSRSSKKKKN